MHVAVMLRKATGGDFLFTHIWGMLVLVYWSQKNAEREGVLLEYGNQHFSSKKGFWTTFLWTFGVALRPSPAIAVWWFWKLETMRFVFSGDASADSLLVVNRWDSSVTWYKGFISVHVNALVKCSADHNITWMCATTGVLVCRRTEGILPFYISRAIELRYERHRRSLLCSRNRNS